MKKTIAQVVRDEKEKKRKYMKIATHRTSAES